MRKILITIGLIVSAICSSQTTYYVSSTGTLDTLNTIADVEALTTGPGDTILFRRGDEFRSTNLDIGVGEGGSAAAYVYFGAYGIGSKPRLLGSEVVENTWVDQGGNIWRAPTSLINPWSFTNGGEVYFERSDSVPQIGYHVNSTGEALENYDWFHDGSTYIYIYSQWNPNTEFTNIELPQRDNVINLIDADYVHFDGLYIAYAYNFGIRDPYTSPRDGNVGFRLSNSEVCYVGRRGSDRGFGIYIRYSKMHVWDNEFHHCGRRSLTTMFIESGSGSIYRDSIVIEGNVFREGYHTTGCDLGAYGSGTSRDWTIRNNLFYENPNWDYTNPRYITSNMIYIESSGDHIYKNFKIYNNIFVGVTAKDIRPEGIDSLYVYNNTFYTYDEDLDPSAYQGLLYFSSGGSGGSVSTNSNIYNNIFYNNILESFSNNFISIYLNDVTIRNETSMDYNLHFCSDFNQRFYVENISFPLTDWTTYKSTTGFDATSPTPADPLFINAENPMSDNTYDFGLTSSSTAIGAGVPNSLVRLDFNNNPIAPYVNRVELGAIQHYDAVDSAEAHIYYLDAPNQIVSEVDTTNKTILTLVESGTSLTIAPNIISSFNSTVDPLPEVEQDFTNIITYTVTSADGTSVVDWDVTIVAAVDTIRDTTVVLATTWENYVIDSATLLNNVKPALRITFENIGSVNEFIDDVLVIRDTTAQVPGPCDGVNIILTADVTNSTGSDGAINLTITGNGQTPYTYLWSNSATTQDISGLSPAYYTVVVTDDNNCTNNGGWTVQDISSGISSPQPYGHGGIIPYY